MHDTGMWRAHDSVFVFFSSTTSLRTFGRPNSEATSLYALHDYSTFLAGKRHRWKMDRLSTRFLQEVVHMCSRKRSEEN
jgi:hypothetical protein